jgi:hypothetical protein
MKPHRLYPPQDPQALGRYYTDHVAGMTEAGLDGKAEIAEQLAWRDKLIAELEASWEEAIAGADAWRFWAAKEHGAELTSDDIARARVDGAMRFVNEARGHLQNQVFRLLGVAAEAAAMLAETNHGGLTHARSESMRKALVKAGVEIPAQCSECPDHENMKR